MKKIKNKITKNKFKITVIFLTVVLIALIKMITAAVPTVSADDTSAIPSLIHNDTVFVFSVPGNNTYTPLRLIDGVFYVPIDMFKNGLNDIKMDSRDRFTDNFYLQYKNNWIAFKASADRADTQSEENITCKVHRIGGITYIPALLTVKALGLKWEYNEQYNTGRIKQEWAEKTIEEILWPYISKTQSAPEPATPAPTTAPPPVEITTEPPTVNIETTDNIYVITTEPPTTTEPTTPENTREIQNYLIFYDNAPYDFYVGGDEPDEPDEIDEIDDVDDAGENEIEIDEDDEDDEDEIARVTKFDRVSEVLNFLDDHNIRAVFFLSGSEITENPDIMRKIYASGHVLGIKFEGGRANFAVDDLIVELETVNDLIYSALKHKSRLCMFEQVMEFYVPGKPEESANAKRLFESLLTEKGYYLCEKTIDVFDLDYTNINETDEMIDFMKREDLNVFVFDLNENYRDYLELSIESSETKFYINFSYINNANVDQVKKRLNGEIEIETN